jgi:hypothetical protein
VARQGPHADGLAGHALLLDDVIGRKCAGHVASAWASSGGKKVSKNSFFFRWFCACFFVRQFWCADELYKNEKKFPKKKEFQKNWRKILVRSVGRCVDTLFAIKRCLLTEYTDFNYQCYNEVFQSYNCFSVENIFVSKFSFSKSTQK